MHWTGLSREALARRTSAHLALEALQLQAARPRGALPRSLYYRPRRSRLLQPALGFNLSTTSVTPAQKTKRDTASDAPASPVRVTDKRNNNQAQPQPQQSEAEPASTSAAPPDASSGAKESAQAVLSEQQYRIEQEQHKQQQQQHQKQQLPPHAPPPSQSQSQQHQPQASSASPNPTHDDLLKQRFYHAQEQNKRVLSGLSSAMPNQSPSLNPSFTLPRSESTVIPPDGSSSTSSSTASASSSASPSNSSASSDPFTQSAGGHSDAAASPQPSQAEHGPHDIEFDPRLFRHGTSPSLQSLQVPFDTHGFVKRLEYGGWVSKVAEELPESVPAKLGKGKQAQKASEPANELQIQIARRHDPAEAIMQGVRHLLTTRGRQLVHACLNKGDVENQAYLFKAALSELRTEVQVRARNDAAGLRSITTLLQREVDALEQKMKEDVERLKHDIQVDMNNRKSESKEEQNNLEQEIQDLNNRFTISLSDLKTEIEQNVKWDATRRSLALVFGIAAIVAANLAIADYLTRDDEAAKAVSKEPVNAGNPPASANAAAPASLGWATEGRILSVVPLMLATQRTRSLALPLRRAIMQIARQAAPAVGTAGMRTGARCRHLEDRGQRVPSIRNRASPSRRNFHTAAICRNVRGTDADTSLHVPNSDVILQLHPTSISIQSNKLGLKPFHLDHVWLRDACQAPTSVHPSNRQKLFHTSDVPLDMSLLDAASPPILITSGDEPVLRLTFAKKHQVINAFTAAFGDPKRSAEAHVSDFPIAFLLRHVLPEYYADTHMDVMGVPQSWAAKDLTHFTSRPWTPDSAPVAGAYDEGSVARPARIPWEDIQPDAEEDHRSKALYSLTEAVVRDGFAFVTRLPTDTTATQAGPQSARLRDLAEMMGELRNTFYGPLWDVQSKADARNIAYTNLDLGLHMDLLYFQNPPRFQYLHMLRNKVRGGASIFVDSFKVAEHMYQHDRDLWEVLTRVPVGFHYVNDGRHYRFTHPTFELAHDTEGHAGLPLAGSGGMPRLSAINYSPPFQSPLPLHPTEYLRTQDDRHKFFQALQRFSDLTLAEEFRYEKQMQEGECVIFDNRRVLHSRKGFEWDESKVGEVKRWLKGCYVDGDAIWSTYRTLRTKLHGRAALVPEGQRGYHTSTRGSCNTTGMRTFVTSILKGSAAPGLPADVSSFAPSSDDPTVFDPRSQSAIRSASQPLSMTSYRPVPPLTLSTTPKLYRQLSKSRLTFLVVLTGMAGYALCPAVLTVAAHSPVTTLLALTAGMTMCSAAANTLNQLVEAPYDAQMPRTRGRPLPSRAVTPLHAFAFASASTAGGVGLLAYMVNPLTALLGAANIVLYSFTYTPMKRMSIGNTWVGAVVGALPPLMGWAACTGTLHLATDLGAWSLAALLFAWQFPHFNSLAHTLRAEYARGGYRMMAVTDPALNRRVSLRYAVALLPICTLMMPLSGIVSPVTFAVLSTPMNLLMAHAAWRFYREGTVKTARWCFWVSLIHLPAVMLLAMGCKPEIWDAFCRVLGWSGDEEEQQQQPPSNVGNAKDPSTKLI
ncbi:hypothetical protein BCV70DRAFT_235655 [Testicularia cyperi]|uniref:Protoheme IX farnesyltransferase, mitochondrial n=1 Tax=Testicularia cyperi TaxID=1882483 RepID=A0A317XXF4_9BASI|nr:hypothetical protein BCV70DRAFT_235655 [Testicularia cyperi]